MIKILGTKRIIVLAVLISINALLAAAVFMYVQPELQQTNRTLGAAKAQENQIRADISDIQMEFDQLEVQQEEFNALKANGFFSNQSRRGAQEIFLRAEQQSGVLEATVSVKPGVVQEDEDAAKADYVLLESEITINLKSIDDRDIYIYLDNLQNNFPGHLSVEEITMRRTANVTDTILRAIRNGQKPPMVEANIDLLWRTMVERADVLDVQQQSNDGGF